MMIQGSISWHLDRSHYLHIGSLLQVAPQGVYDIDLAHLVALDAVRLRFKICFKNYDQNNIKNHKASNQP